MSKMRWRLASDPPPEMFSRFPELPAVAVRLLWNRGLATQEQVDEFLLPDYGQDLHDPFLFRDMEKACGRVWQALEAREPIVVYSDYDADGVTGAVTLVSTFRAVARKLGADPALITSYIPHREREGYGVRTEAVESLVRAGARLIVTVDCGIGSAAELARARELGADAIVVDHHQVPERVPECLTIHPLVAGETYPYKYLAAVGVAFKFACAFIRYAAGRGAALDPGFDKWLLDLVAIATVTDFMPLVGENRTLERYGLVVLNKTRRPGLKKLIEAAGLKPGALDTVSVGFYIGPRINAASRIDHGSLAFETLMAETDEAAGPLAERLDRLNSERQRYTDEIVTVARSMIGDGGGRKVHVLAGDGWAGGIVGLIAGKLSGETGVPVFVFGRDGDKLVGSGRSAAGFDVMAGLDRTKRFLSRYGGHPQACGLTIIGEDNFQGFRQELETYAAEALAGQDLRPAVEVDAELKLSEVTWELVEWLEKFEPFGEGNQRPKFLLSGLQVISSQTVGKTGKHVRLGVLGDRPKESKLIGFNLAAAAAAFRPGSRIDAVVEVGVNEWNGNREIQLKAVDLRAAEESLERQAEAASAEQR